ncbi:TPA: DUF551 domain-containing protein [Raoultella ornithinolytica]
MPDETQPVIVVSEGGVVQRTIYQFCEGVWNDWYDLYDDVNVEAFTHWMPLPAAPQEAQDNINALIPLVSRNEREVK